MKRLTMVGWAAMLVLTGCSFQGVNSLPLPGTRGRESDATIYHLQLSNVGTLESNSPVMVDDVVVGRVGKMAVDNWHADVEVAVEPGVAIPANARATVGQTSLLGSMHLALDPPVGESPAGRLAPGSTIGLAGTSTYPSTENTLSSISALVNSGGLGQIGDVIHNLNAGLSGREGRARDLLGRLNTFVGVFDAQRDNMVASMAALDRLSGTFAAQRDIVSDVVRKLPPALDVLIRQQPRLTTALDKLRVFSDTATGLVNDSQADLVRNLTNLDPAFKALNDVGPDIDDAIAYAPTAPLNQNLIDRGVRGDYVNLFVTVDLTTNRIKKGLALGTRYGNEDLSLVPAPGDPGYNAFYSNDPLNAPLAPPPAADVPVILPPGGAPVVPVSPPSVQGDSAPGGPSSPIFAGPYQQAPPPGPPPFVGGG